MKPSPPSKKSSSRRTRKSDRLSKRPLLHADIVTSRLEIVTLPLLSVNYSGHRDIIHPPRTVWLKLPIYLILLVLFTILGAILFYLCEELLSEHGREQMLEYEQCERELLSMAKVDPSKGCIRNFAKEPQFFKNYTTGIGYAISVYTTIGYGDLVPHTDWGKILTILYGTIGIPLNLAFLADSMENFIPGVMHMIRFLHRISCSIVSCRWIEEMSDIDHYYVPCWIKFPLAVIPWTCLMYAGIIMLTPDLDGVTSFVDALHFSYATIAFIGFGDIVPTYDWKFYIIHLPIIFIGQVTEYTRYYYIQTLIRSRIHMVTGLFSRRKEKCNPDCSINSPLRISPNEPYVNPFRSP